MILFCCCFVLLKEGEALLKGEKLGGTRSESSATKKAAAEKPKAAAAKKPAKLAKARTMAETAKVCIFFFNNLNLNFWDFCFKGGKGVCQGS